MNKKDEEFSIVLEETQSQLRAYIAGMGVSFDQADDIAQDVFIHYFKEFTKKPAEVEHAPWLKGIAKNYCKRYFEKMKKEKVSKEKFMRVIQLVQDCESSLEKQESHSVLDKLKKCMRGLSKENLFLLKSKYEEGLSYDQLGKEMNMTTAAMGMLLMRIRKSLQKCVKKGFSYEF